LEKGNPLVEGRAFLKMIPFFKNTFLGLVLALGFASRTLADSAPLDSSVHLQADRIEYLRDQALVTAKGRVHLTEGQITLFCDSLRYDTAAREVDAIGHVVFQNGAQEIDADEMTFNTGTQDGKAVNAKTTVPPWICTGAEIQFQDKKVIVKDARATSCDYALDYDHYHLQADTITFYQGDYMTAENLVLYIGKVPVFYFPFFAIRTKNTQFPFSISVGSSGYLGNYALVSTSYLLNPKSYGAFYADYFSNKGIGLGLRHEIALNDYSTLSLYAYRVQEKDTGNVRWESRIRGLWAFSSSLQGRIEADIPGDGFFSQDYAAARRDPSLVSTQREYDLSATYSRDPLTVGVLFRHQELSDSAEGAPAHFVETSDSLPQINISLFPQSLIGKNWLKYDLTLNADRTWTLANNFYVGHVSGEFGISETIPFLQTQSLYTRAAFDDAYQNISDAGVTDAGETRSFSLNNVYTGHWSDYFDTSLTYNYAQKLTNRSPSDPPGGVTSNLLTGNLEFIGGSFFRSNTSTSINFAAPVPDFASQFSYLRQEIYLTPSNALDFYNIADYSIKANALKDLDSRLSITSPRGFWQFIIGASVVDPNISNLGYVSAGQPNSFNVSGEVDIALFTNYRLSYLETYDMTNARFETRSVSLYRDLHDWQAELSYSQTQGQPAAVFFTLDLKAFPGRPLSISQTSLQQLNSLQTQSALQLLETTSDQLK
jgi:lipopolysaccharide export system protein LptA